MEEVLAQRCTRCVRDVIASGPLDRFGVCPSCSEPIREQVAAALPALERDCDNLGAFHAWCIEHDRQAA